MFGRLIRRWAEYDTRQRLAEARAEIENLQRLVKTQELELARHALWQAREEERLKTETAILVSRREMALDMRRLADVDAGGVGE